MTCVMILACLARVRLWLGLGLVDDGTDGENPRRPSKTSDANRCNHGSGMACSRILDRLTTQTIQHLSIPLRANLENRRINDETA